ncbi:AAA family ATPase [Antarcticimicrobium luteum]|uniref:AAA family ATPase n=1 Tax=Antarcticimicrobium luteum TaxID=2547397 RepID=A0A4R5VDE4_9RHOB|nr:AAA family ATPase [Antarcticimicrobium luteum]TDK50351.1 AAA family ATPase [Antarcticimicrobium luteum]
MSHIPFIAARFFNPEENRSALEQRFTRYLRQLRSRSAPPLKADEGASTIEAALNSMVVLSEKDRMRISRRVAAFLERREAVSGVKHLRKDDREQLMAVRDGVRLVSIESEHRADELASRLHTEMPWMAPATEIIWYAMRRSVREGWPGLRLPPLLLDGPPGIGKSYWARRLGEVISAPTAVIEATGENASFGLVGSQRGWSGAQSGRVLETILQARVGNPVIVVDEVEKAGTPTSRNGHTFGLAEALLPLLEPMTAENWSCPYFRVKFDMSWVGWVLTSNTYRLLPEPLLSRCPPLRLRDLTQGELIGFIRREGKIQGLSEDVVEAIAEALGQASVGSGHLNLRTASRLLRWGADIENRPLRH